MSTLCGLIDLLFLVIYEEVAIVINIAQDEVAEEKRDF